MRPHKLKDEVERLAHEQPGIYLSEAAEILGVSAFDVLDAAKELMREGKVWRGMEPNDADA